MFNLNPDSRHWPFFLRGANEETPLQLECETYMRDQEIVLDHEPQSEEGLWLDEIRYDRFCVVDILIDLPEAFSESACSLSEEICIRNEISLEETPYSRLGADELVEAIIWEPGERKVAQSPRPIQLQTPEKTEINELERYLVDSNRFMLWEENLCFYDGSMWVKLSKQNTNRFIRRCLEEGGLEGALIASDFNKIKNLLHSNERLVRDDGFQNTDFLINFRGGAIDTRTWTVRPPGPDDGFFYCLNMDVQDILDPPVRGDCFMRFLETVSGGDEDVIRQVFELIYLILSRVPIKNFFAIVGPPSTGKSQVGRFLQELVGYENTCTIRDLSDFSDKWTAGEFVGKSFVGCFDLPQDVIPERAVGLIKQLVGSDSIKTEVKGKSPVTIFNKPLFVCAGNYGIKLHSDDDAFLERLVTIPFCNGVPKEERVFELYKLFLDEKEWIVHQAITIGNELYHRDLQVTRSYVPDEFQVKTHSTSHSDDISVFFENGCCIEPNSAVSTEDLYQHYCDLSSKEGLAPLAFRTFSFEFKRYVQSRNCGVRYNQNSTQKDVRGYRGIALRDLEA